MDQRTNQILFALLRSAVFGKTLTDEERNGYSPEQLEDLLRLSSKHDVAHLLAFGLQQNGLISAGKSDLDVRIFKAVYRYEQFKYEYESLCNALEKAGVPFLPLKGSVLRDFYPEPWMRTSCDIDILVHDADIDKATSYLEEHLHYTKKERASHDVSLFSPTGIHLELHFDLVEEGYANHAVRVLQSVWDQVSLREGFGYWYEMRDPFFYFYHIAHMAKHFEFGGCGIRPFLDLRILDRMEGADKNGRDELLAKADLLQFANACRALCDVWFDGREADSLTEQMQAFLFHGGVYGSMDNRVALQQKKKGGRVGYVLRRVFVPYAKLKRYYPILEKHPVLTPVMQVRRWFTLLKPDVAKRAKKEVALNMSVDKSESEQMNDFFARIGL